MHIHQGHYKCESECTYFQTCKVCAHVVAVAQRNGDLEKVIAWHKRQDHGIDATALAQVGLPKASIGKKQATKKKSAKICKLCAEVDESSWQPRAALTTAHAGPHSSQSPSSQFPPPFAFPPQAQAQCSTPSSVQAFTSQQQMSPPAILSQPQDLPSTPSQTLQANPCSPWQQVDPFTFTFIRGNISGILWLQTALPTPNPSPW